MALSTVMLVCDLVDGRGQPVSFGSVKLTPNTTLTDPGDQVIVTQQTVEVPFSAEGSPSVVLLATDDAGLSPSGWTWGASFNVTGGPSSFSFFLPAGPVSFTATDASPAVFTFTPTTQLTELPDGTIVELAGGSLPAGFTAATPYYVVSATGQTVQLAATPGGSAIASTSTGSGQITVTQWRLSALSPAGTAPLMSIYLLASNNLLDVASAVAARSNLGLGTAATQNSGAFDAAGAAGAAQAASLQKSANLSDLASASTARTSLGLGSAATQSSSAFDAAGTASTAQAAAIAASLPTLVQASASASAALAVNTVTTVTAATALTMTLPASVAGALIVVERESASAANVAVTGNIRGVGAQTVTLQLASESEMFLGYGGSWWPVAGHKTLSSLTALFDAAGAAAAVAAGGVAALLDATGDAWDAGVTGALSPVIQAETGFIQAQTGELIEAVWGTAVTGTVTAASVGVQYQGNTETLTPAESLPAVAHSVVPAFASFHAAVGQRDTAAVSIALLGDSVTEGAGNTSYLTRYGPLLGRNLRQRYPTTANGSNGGLGYMPLILVNEGSEFGSNPWPVTSTGTFATNLNGGPTFDAPQMTAACTFSFTAPAGTTSVKIMWANLGSATAGTWSYAVNGGSATNVSNSGTPSDGQLTGAVTMTGGDVLAISWVSGTVTVDGFIHYAGDESSGITVHTCGHYGARASICWQQMPNGVALAALAPQLVIFEFGINEIYVDALTPAGLTIELANLVSWVRNASGLSAVPVVFIIPYEVFAGTAPQTNAAWGPYHEAYRSLEASIPGVHCIDLSARMPGIGTAYAGSLFFDTVHPADPGSALMAEIIAAGLQIA